MAEAKEMTDIDIISKINHLEDRIDEQEFEIKSLRAELKEQDEATLAVFKAIVKDIEYLDKHKKDDFCL